MNLQLWEARRCDHTFSTGSVRRTLGGVGERVTVELFVSSSCLRCCQTGFSQLRFL